jgi:uncharacterized integral membrane protein
MKSLANLSAIGIMVIGMIAASLISVQNAEPISLRLFGFQSIPIPFGVLLTFAMGLGMIIPILLKPILVRRRRNGDALSENYD